MMSHSPAPRRTARAVVRLAARIAPRDRRDQMIREWDAELERAFRDGGGWNVVRSSLGAFSDALAIRRVAAQRARRGRLAGWVDGVRGDLRTSLRGLRRSPGFAALSVLTLAVGLGGVTAIYTVVDRVVLDPLPYPDADRLVRIENRVPGVSPDEVWRLSTAQWVHYTERSRTLDEVGLYLGDQGGIMPGGNIMADTGPYRASGAAVTASTVRMLGVRPYVGRLIDESDDQPGTPLVVLLTYEFWRDVLGADPDVIGKPLYSQQASEIIGVLEPGAELPGWPSQIRIDLWFPMQTNRSGPFGNSHVFPGIARLAPGATVEDAQAELDALQTELPERFSRVYSQGFFDQYGFRTVVEPLKDDVVGTLARDLWILLGGVVLVLLIACANVVNLFAVRTAARAREMRLRAALGASRAALARYALVEGTLLALIGGTFAIGVAYWAIPGLVALAPDGLPRVQHVRIGVDGALLALAMSLCIGLALSAHSLVSGRLRTAGSSWLPQARPHTSGPGGARLRSGLVVGQVALAATLAVGAGLLVRGIRDLRDTELGFEPEGALAVDLYPDFLRYPEDSDLWTLYRTLLERVEALPGVAAAGLGEELPVTGGYGCTVQGFEDESIYDRVRQAGMTTCAGQEIVTPGYFAALGIPVLQGRAIEAADADEPGRASVVVSQAFADRFWPGQDAIGQGVAPGGRTIPPFYHVVGVVGDVPRASEPAERPFAESAIAIYYPTVHDPNVTGSWGRWALSPATLVVRSRDGEAMDLFASVRSVIEQLDPELPIANARSMDGIVSTELSSIAFVSLLFGIAAAAALILAAVGLYGVISYAVACRTRELGMRMAIGARQSQLERMVIGQTLALVGLGLVAAVPLAWGAVRVAQAVLVGVEVLEPTAYLAAAATMVAIALVAGWLPARRAGSVDPMEALRAE